ncbi:MAG: gliding motility-associated C-terminal domain-containing protein [Bacteroidetes bacterium]|nr:gliding motility-associated C-terminal domain-containing protein [Bacteroidota bacterium]
MITEYRGGVKIGSVLRDMQITVECNDNVPPEITPIMDTCVVAGDVIQFVVFASDSNNGDYDGQTVTLTAEGGPFEVANDTATFGSNFGMDTVSQTFTWATTCEHIALFDYTVVFKAVDNYKNELGKQIPLADLETWLIKVVAPPPENLIATAAGNDIVLDWDATYSCYNASHFRGFSIWRREGSNPFTIDSCRPGLANKGYVKIAQNVQGFSFEDENLKRGKTYCYRVLADFGLETDIGNIYNKVSSIPSNEACAQLKRDVPVITNVSVERTSTTNGNIYVAWAHPLPEDLDTIQNPGPYRYELRRCPGFDCDPDKLITSFSSPSFVHLTDSTFLDSMMDTKTQPWTYRVDYFVDGNDLIGETETASSVFLSIAASDNQLDLSWKAKVPWTNTSHIIYKYDSVNMVWDSLDRVTDTFYIDDGLRNLVEYCYYVITVGSYSSPGFIDPIVNNSQEECGIPIDTVPPCPPVLTIDNQCSLENAETADFCNQISYVNQLSWTDPNVACEETDDVIKYMIYFSRDGVSEFELIDSVFSHDVLTYDHDRNWEENLAGCYMVTAIDSFNNESKKVNQKCIDNCPCYILPNVFSPNNDSRNDLFIPFPYRFIDHIDVKIYNRWGGMVYQHNDPDIKWDGTDQQTGKPLIDGVYYYVCDVFVTSLNGIQKVTPLTGYVHLIRGAKN